MYNRGVSYFVDWCQFSGNLSKLAQIRRLAKGSIEDFPDNTA